MLLINRTQNPSLVHCVAIIEANRFDLQFSIAIKPSFVDKKDLTQWSLRRKPSSLTVLYSYKALEAHQYIHIKGGTKIAKMLKCLEPCMWMQKQINYWKSFSSRFYLSWPRKDYIQDGFTVKAFDGSWWCICLGNVIEPVTYRVILRYFRSTENGAPSSHIHGGIRSLNSWWDPPWMWKEGA